jgi:aerobic carbon-monoxide dehydrogenase small subunit
MRVALTVNGRPVSAEVAPRTHLADFLREHLNHTGTHIGCEHGICGACTVEIDGELARSCITYTVCCDGASVRSIEAFDDDAIMRRLRQAFTHRHALQCGYCTPGMLIAARDLVRRKRGLSREAIRLAMSGNLCRCTGYSGIINAIEDVMVERAGAPVAEPHPRGGWLGPAPGPAASGAPRPEPPPPKLAPARTPEATPAPLQDAPVRVAVEVVEQLDGSNRLTERFELAHPRAAVWELMADTERVARCMPGVSLDGPPQDGAVRGRLNVKIGPITARFAGAGSVQRFAEDFRQVITASGGDHASGSRVAASIDYRLTALTAANGSAATRVDITIDYSLTGPLAQIGRSAIARDLARRIGESFAANLDASLAGRRAPPQPAPLAGGRLLLALLADRLRALFGLLASRR